MGEMVELATWRARRLRDRTNGAAHAPAGEETSEEARAATAGAPRAIVRSVVVAPSEGSEWHPSLGTALPMSAASNRAAEGAQISRLERAVRRIDRVTARIASRDGRVAPEVETELLALVGQVTLGMVGQAADRAERLVRTLGGTATSPS